MLLVQPFDPYKEEKKKLTFFTRCRMMSRRTRDALLDIRDRVHTARRFAHVKLPTPMMLTPPPPQPWCYCCCHCMYSPDPFVSSPMIPPPPPISFTQVVPYPVCLHISLEQPIPMASTAQEFDADDRSVSSTSSSTLENEYDYIDNLNEKEDSPAFIRKSVSIRSYHSQWQE